MKRNTYWKGKARQHRYAVLMRDGASKYDAKRHSVGAFSFAVYYEARRYVAEFWRQFRSDLDLRVRDDGTQPPRELTGLQSIIGES